jgi:aminoglycoside 3-N-acetyltransferase I
MKARFKGVIRLLVPGDAPLMAMLSAMFAEAFDEVDLHRGKQPDADYLEKLLAREHFIALAALKGKEVVGGIVAYELPKYEQARSEIYLYDLAVAEAHRREGIATGLIMELKQIAATRGGNVIFVQADQGDAPAIALYSKLGVREDVLHFDIDVP